MIPHLRFSLALHFKPHFFFWLSAKKLLSPFNFSIILSSQRRIFVCVKSEVNLTRNLRDTSLKIESRVYCWYRIFRFF